MGKSSIEAQERRIAFWMLLPSLLIVLSIVLFPVLLNFWVSFKPIRLGDLRPPSPIVREKIVLDDQIVRIQYQVRNTSPDKSIALMTIVDIYPPSLQVQEIPTGFEVVDGQIRFNKKNIPGGFLETYQLTFLVTTSQSNLEEELENSIPIINSHAHNILTDLRFTLDNYRIALQTRELFQIMLTTILYAVLGSSGALLLGLIAAILVNQKFPGNGAVRSLFLFPYVTPIVAVAFVWRFLLDAQSGTVNEILSSFNLLGEPISFLSIRPTALITAIFFNAWRYFPFCYLFVFARLKAIPSVLYESAQIEGAGKMQTFWHITLPQISEVLLSVFMLRFIWTFNNFDDLFLLTGGAAGTKTLPVQVYDYALGSGNIGGGAAFSVILFLLLSCFLFVFLSRSREVES